MSPTLNRWQPHSVWTVNSQEVSDARLLCLEQRPSMLTHLQNAFPIPGASSALESITWTLLCSHSPDSYQPFISLKRRMGEQFLPSCPCSAISFPPELACHMLLPLSCVSMYIIVICEGRMDKAHSHVQFSRRVLRSPYVWAKLSGPKSHQGRPDGGSLGESMQAWLPEFSPWNCRKQEQISKTTSDLHMCAVGCMCPLLIHAHVNNDNKF